MNQLHYTLITDGSSDRALIPILTWLLHQHLTGWDIQPTWADFRVLRNPPGQLSNRIRLSLDLYPCELLFVHRDAENQSHNARIVEIKKAVTDANLDEASKPIVCVVPVRMQEAWLLIDEAAIREAAANRNGQQTLNLPSLTRLEEIPNPKQRLYELLRIASDLHGRRLENFNVRESAQRVSDFVSNFALLRQLSAFREFEKELQDIIEKQGWNTQN